MYFLFDIGGTNTRCAIAHTFDMFEEPIIFSTPEDPQEGLELLKTHARTLGEGVLFKGICGGIPGILSHEGVLMRAPHLDGWKGVNLHDALVPLAAPNAPLRFVNDAALVGLGEVLAGAGRGFDVVGYITISTGVGGVRIVGGELEKNIHSFEPGFQLLPGKDGTLSIAEELLSGDRLEKKLGKPPFAVEDHSFWDMLEEHLAHMLHNTNALWMPDVIILGGSMITGDKKSISLLNTEKKLRACEETLGTDALPLPILKKAELGAFGGLHGALGLLRQCKGDI